MTAAGQAWQVDDLTVGNVFRAVRRRRRLRQLDVAQASGVSPSYWYATGTERGPRFARYRSP
jgi:hypothetical protein